MVHYKTKILILLLTLFVESVSAVPQISADHFQNLSLTLSEPGGYFDTDNLISNEASYQHIIPAVRRHVPKGQAYIGVGPDQNFTYILHTRPHVAFIVDIRADNRLLMLYYKVLFEESPTRWDFIGGLLGRETSGITPPENAELPELLDQIQRVPPDIDFFEEQFQRKWAVLEDRAGRLLENGDKTKVYRMARTFFEENLRLKFRSFGRPPRPHYPSLKDLYLETDRTGLRRHYLNREEDYQFLRNLQIENRIVPVVGDIAGPWAMERIAQLLRKWEMKVGAFYLSNVEFYLFNGGRFDRFARNFQELPLHSEGLLLRSYFSYGFRHPESVPGYSVASLVQKNEDFLRDLRIEPYRNYWEMILRGYLPLTTD